MSRQPRGVNRAAVFFARSFARTLVVNASHGYHELQTFKHAEVAVADVMLIKYDAGSPADKTIERILKATNGKNALDAFAYSITIADYLTQLGAAGRKVLIQRSDGKYEELPLDAFSVN